VPIFTYIHKSFLYSAYKFDRVTRTLSNNYLCHLTPNVLFFASLQIENEFSIYNDAKMQLN